MYWYILGLFWSECQSLLPVTIGWLVLPWEFYCCASLSFDHLPTIAKAQVMTCWWRQVGSSTKGSYFHAEHSTISQKLQGLCFQWFSEACRLQRAILHRNLQGAKRVLNSPEFPLSIQAFKKTGGFWMFWVGSWVPSLVSRFHGQMEISSFATATSWSVERTSAALLLRSVVLLLQLVAFWTSHNEQHSR